MTLSLPFASLLDKQKCLPRHLLFQPSINFNATLHEDDGLMGSELGGPRANEFWAAGLRARIFELMGRNLSKIHFRSERGSDPILRTSMCNG